MKFWDFKENESIYFGKQLKIFASFLTLVHKMSGLCLLFIDAWQQGTFSDDGKNSGHFAIQNDQENQVSLQPPVCVNSNQLM